MKLFFTSLWITTKAPGKLIDDETRLSLSGGLSLEELSKTLSILLAILLASQKAIGMSIAIFNPTLDKDRSVAKAFVNSIVKRFEEDAK